ncbi:hypothetical protein [Wukongibacter baidiensis]
MKKAFDFYDIQEAVAFTQAIKQDSEFYVNFEGFRGDFKDKKIYRYLNIDPHTMECKNNSLQSKKVIFLAGHRGSGKTTELNKISEKIKGSKCFYPITINLDEKDSLDVNNIDFVDLLILMLETLSGRLKDDNIDIKEESLETFYNWYSERIDEVNSKNKAQIVVKAGIESKVSIPTLFKLFANVRSSLSGTEETKTIIRTTFKNKFTDFALKFNEFLEKIILELNNKGFAKDLIFILDGFEKIGSLETRKKILLDDANRLSSIKTNMIISLPIELIKESAKLSNFSKILSFPVIKIREKNGDYLNASLEKFKELVYKRVDKSLFFNDDVVENIIKYSGGSPRELLRIIEQAYIEADDDIIDMESVDRAVKGLSSDFTNFITKEELGKLKEMKECLENDKEIYFDETLQELLEKRIVFEYNSGSYKRVNPIVESTKIYSEFVGE